MTFDQEFEETITLAHKINGLLAGHDIAKVTIAMTAAMLSEIASIPMKDAVTLWNTHQQTVQAAFEHRLSTGSWPDA